MPELPEVETVKQGLNQTTLNAKILGGDVLLERTIAHPFSMSEFVQGLEGRVISQWHRRGKYLLAELTQADGEFQALGSRSQGLQEGQITASSLFNPEKIVSSAGWLGVHLRMTGQLLWVSPDQPLEKHCRVRLFFQSSWSSSLQNRWELRFVDQRTFGQMWWVPPGQAPAEIITGLQQLGPEPFDPKFSVNYLTTQLHSRQRPIKNALLDQRLVAGIGNIYADEALFLSGIQPTVLCSQLKRQQIQALHSQICTVLQNAIQVGGTTIRNFLNVAGLNGNYGQTAWVYNRAGKPCRVCGTPIQRLKLAGRSAHFCPVCQKSASGR
ncbi:MAG: DNA-formamidopyrimidine glycosylase [Oscillatoriales cyanobacterium RM1_1_9]|nr:DNA-formamidopyrimidine glycosylase [Oscillatoriales cyanobacterium RM2_1_1]NJO70938.1 DNA-formamidopyrimidine glycosylase [Oscillatoriales cyanobacterium RM1_1_9]